MGRAFTLAICDNLLREFKLSKNDKKAVQKCVELILHCEYALWLNFSCDGNHEEFIEMWNLNVASGKWIPDAMFKIIVPNVRKYMPIIEKIMFKRAVASCKYAQKLPNKKIVKDSLKWLRTTLF